jgi:hypothetical protein
MKTNYFDHSKTQAMFRFFGAKMHVKTLLSCTERSYFAVVALFFVSISLNMGESMKRMPANIQRMSPTVTVV